MEILRRGELMERNGSAEKVVEDEICIAFEGEIMYHVIYRFTKLRQIDIFDHRKLSPQYITLHLVRRLELISPVNFL